MKTKIKVMGLSAPDPLPYPYNKDLDFKPLGQIESLIDAEIIAAGDGWVTCQYNVFGETKMTNIYDPELCTNYLNRRTVERINSGDLDNIAFELMGIIDRMIRDASRNPLFVNTDKTKIYAPKYVIDLLLSVNNSESKINHSPNNRICRGGYTIYSGYENALILFNEDAPLYGNNMIMRVQIP